MNYLKNKRIDPLLLGIAVLSAFLNIYGIWKDQYANAYYTAAVTSMLQSFHNFFYASFDPGGFVTVDKPPVAFWIQTLSASIFGVHGWSVILPQALAGVGSVFLIYALVKSTFGQTAARVSALVFACTPIAAAVSRTNNIDSLLVFILLMATWFLFKAAKTKKWGWSVAAFAMVGVGFNTKMLQAYMIVPALYLFYLLAFQVNWKKKLKGLAISTVALLLVSLSWPVIVDSTPAANRPYVGGSQTNSVLELAFGYNGISRLTGNRGAGGVNRGANQFREDNGRQNQQGNPPQGFGSGANGNSGGMPSLDDGLRNYRNDRQGGFIGGQGNPGGGGMFNTGTPGPLRLFQSSLSGQISWLLPFALLSGVGLLLGYRRKNPLTAKQKEALFWLAWLLPMMGFFSVAGFFHQYYLIMLAPAIAALTGAGWVEIYDFYKNREGWKKWLLPVGILGTAGFQVYILLPYAKQIGYIWPAAVGILGAGSALVMIVMMNKEKLARFAAIGGIFVLLAAPLYWAATPIIYGGNSMLPAAGPSNENFGGMPGGMQGAMTGGAQSGAKAMGGSSENVNLSLMTYLMSNNTGEKYLFATTDAGTAEPYIIQTGKAVMAMGGFSGTDKILTVDKLKQMIQNKEVKYFLISSGGPGGGQGSSDILTWIKENGKEIPQSEWEGSSANTQTMETTDETTAAESTAQNSTAANDSQRIADNGRNRNGNTTLYEVNLEQGGEK
ncbi:ArnT family glycosyltransferase [Desulfitobacterium sp. AusDCA]|uniref:ArnT family glycosyltransferase n=1 Tax=Desulfitobacterium sp. AusDCA TaxID=3240383 RepID=UPI003DA76CC5